MLAVATVSSLIGLGGIWASESTTMPALPQSGPWTGMSIAEINWVDGDSGTIDGHEFRLHGVDAPEGSPSRAHCRAERERATRARVAARQITRNANIAVSVFYGADPYGRELVDLTVNGADVATLLVAKGHLQLWNFESGQPKPDWCGLAD